MKKVAEHYDSLAGSYEEDYEDDPYWNLYHDITWNNIKIHLPKKSSLIADIGGGTGFWARKLVKNKPSHNVVVTDISENMLKVGASTAKRKKLSKHILFRYADAERMPDLKTERYDFVLCQGDVLSYVKSPEHAAQEIVRIAKPGAKIIVSVKSFFATLRFTLAHNPKALKKLESTHLISFNNSIPYYSFTPEELKAMFQNLGCEVISLIGKPVLTSSQFHSTVIDRKRLLALEKKYNSHASLVAGADSLEIVVRKL